MTASLIKEAEIRPLFELLFKRVEEAMQSCAAFESLIRNFKSTLDPLQPWIKGECKGLEVLGNKELVDLDEKIRKGIEIIGKFTNVHIWEYYMRRCDYSDQLVQLDRYFNKLLDRLLTKVTCDWKQLVGEMDRRQSAIAEKLSQLGPEMLEKQEGLSVALLSLRNTETVLTVCDRMAEEGAEELYASLETAYWSLVSSIEQTKEKSATIFKPLLEDLIWTVHDSGKPNSNDVKWHSKEELEKLRAEMKHGTEMVRECCKVGEKASYNTKYKYINALLGLNQSLRRKTYVKFEKVREDMVEMRNRVEPVVDRVERALALALQIQKSEKA